MTNHWKASGQACQSKISISNPSVPDYLVWPAFSSCFIDKAYVGLTPCGVITPVKRNEIPYKKDKIKTKRDNQQLSSRRIKIEHVFAWLKSWRILKQLHDFSRNVIDKIFQSLVHIHNIKQITKLTS